MELLAMSPSPHFTIGAIDPPVIREISLFQQYLNSFHQSI
jgi:hypothetical protein